MPLQTFVSAPVDADALTSLIAGLKRFGRMRYFMSIDSTNAQALAVIGDDGELGKSFLAEYQRRGRGRAGRTWLSPPGAGLLITTILPANLPNSVLPAVGFWAALAVAGAVEVICNVPLGFKWPNDVLLSTKKCGGILSEGKSYGGFSRVALGVGLNVNRPADFPLDMEATSAWLSDATGRVVDRTKLAAALLAEYERTFEPLLTEPTDIIRTWARQALLLGRRLIVKDLDGKPLHEGIGRGVADDGALLLETPQGIISVTLGDVAVEL